MGKIWIRDLNLAGIRFPVLRVAELWSHAVEEMVEFQTHRAEDLGEPQRTWVNLRARPCWCLAGDAVKKSAQHSVSDQLRTQEKQHHERPGPQS